MSIDSAVTDAPRLIERVKNILAQPTAEWERIAAETTPVPALVAGYLLPLCIAVAVASLFGGLLMTGFFLSTAMLVPMLAGAAVQVTALVVGVLLWGLAINALAPSFDSKRDRARAFRLSAYSATGVLVASLSLLVPVVAFLVVAVGIIYSGLLLYYGLPSMMGTPENKRVPYALTTIAIAIAASFVFALIYGNLAQTLSPAHSYTFAQTEPGAQQEAAPHGIDLQRLQRYTAAGQDEIATLDPRRVEAQLPPSLPGGFHLQSMSSAAAPGLAQAEGVYRSGDAVLTVTIVQAGGVDALAAIAAELSAWQQADDGYARLQTIEGRVYAERVDSHAQSASYAVIGRGIAVKTVGTSGVTLDHARAAVDIIDIRRLEREFGA